MFLPQSAGMLAADPQEFCHILVLFTLLPQTYHLIPERLLHFLFEFTSIYLFHGKKRDRILEYFVAVGIIERYRVIKRHVYKNCRCLTIFVVLQKQLMAQKDGRKGYVIAKVPSPD